MKRKAHQLLNTVTKYSRYLGEPFSYYHKRYMFFSARNMVVRNGFKLIGALSFGFMFCSVFNVEYQFHKVNMLHIDTQYQKFIKILKNPKPYVEKHQIASKILKKGERQQLSTIQYMMLAQIAPEQQLKIHGQYLASLK